MKIHAFDFLSSQKYILTFFNLELGGLVGGLGLPPVTEYASTVRRGAIKHQGTSLLLRIAFVVV